MTDAELDDLRAWAYAHALVGCARARQVLELLDCLRVRNGLIVAMADRIHAQSELLSRAAARAATPANTSACHNGW